MRPGRLLIWGVGGRALNFLSLIPASSRASSLPQWICEYRTNVGASLLAKEPVQATSVYQNDRTIRPNVSMAFSDSSVHGLP
ncbi:hypothetical protein E1508_14610 [Pseudomonas moraviensis]|nr:hypothetical protein E1508_14610 [Pseudomonas moraviensis]